MKRFKGFLVIWIPSMITDALILIHWVFPIQDRVIPNLSHHNTFYGLAFFFVYWALAAAIGTASARFYIWFVPRVIFVWRKAHK